MKIGVSTLALYPLPLEDILTFLEDSRVDYGEIIMEYPLENPDPEILTSHSLQYVVHAPLYDINIASLNDSIRKFSISQIKKSMDLAANLDSDVVVVHPGQVPFLAQIFEDQILKHNFDSLKECASYAEDLGIKLCVENMPDIGGYLFKDLNNLYDVVEKLGVFLTLDVGHAHNMNFSTDEMVKSNLLGHIHLSDNDGSFDNHEALGKGTLDFDNLLKNLKKQNYNGNLTIEVKNKEEVLESLDYLHQKIDKL